MTTADLLAIGAVRQAATGDRLASAKAFGSSITAVVGPPGGLLTARIPSNAPILRSMPFSPVPREASAPPCPSSCWP